MVKNLKSNLQNKITKNISWLFFEKVIRIIFGIYLGTLIARYLGVESFGVLNFSTAYISVFSVIATFGIQSIVIRDLVNDFSSKEEIIGTSLALVVILSLFAYVLSILSIILINKNGDIGLTLVVIIGLTLFFKFSDVFMYLFESQLESKYVARTQMVVLIIFSLVKLLLIFNQYDLLYFGWVYVFESLVQCILMFCTFKFMQPSIVKLTISIVRGKKLIKESFPLMLASLSIALYLRVDEIMLAYFLGYEAVGVYAAAVRVSESIYFIPVVISASYFPSLVDKIDNKKLLFKNIQKIFDLMVFIAILISIFISCFSDYLIMNFFGVNYIKASNILLIHTWASIFVFLGTASSKWLIAKGYQIIAFKRTFLGLIINIFLNLMLIPYFGPEGAAWATLISYSIVGLFSDLFQKETHEIFLMKINSLNIFGIYKRAFK